MAAQGLYLPRYQTSRALVIGINNYQHIGPLMHARNDANAIAEILVKNFAFSRENIDLLTEENATREAILRTFLQYASAEPDDRILVFFAGHGHTITGRRGEIGYLVPVDGNVDDLSSLIRWDEFTRNADLIPAKHILFLMDACYGGLALTRTIRQPGSMRFLKDMLQRYARQVLTAGKGDEVVSDSGGTRRGHSIFTSHLLDGMEGAAAPGGRTLTGYGLMAYVYEKVGRDPQSRQTPHFGFIDGDGDFIFDTSLLAGLRGTPSTEPEPDLDIFLETPAFSSPAQQEETITDALKRLIASPSEKIRFSDFISSLLRKAAQKLSGENFPLSTPFSKDEFVSRVQHYEEAISDLMIAVILLAQYADAIRSVYSRKLFPIFLNWRKGKPD
jgi:hypothetical protein